MGAVARACWRCVGADIVVCVCLCVCVCVYVCVCVCVYVCVCMCVFYFGGLLGCCACCHTVGEIARARWRCVGADTVVCVCLGVCICVHVCVCVCVILAEGLDEILVGALWEQSLAFVGAM